MWAWPRLTCCLVLMSVASFAQQPGAARSTSGTFGLTTTAFAAGAAIPEQYTCKGHDISPALQGNGAPVKTGSFVMIMDDPDAPAGVWVHWVMWNLPRS